MTGLPWPDPLLGIAGALLLTSLVLVAVRAIVRPRGGLLREALRILSDGTVD